GSGLARGRRGLRASGAELLRRERIRWQRVRQPLEDEALRPRAGSNFACIKVALGIDRQVMQPLEISRLVASLSELIENLEALSIQYGNVRIAVVGDVQKLLLGIRRERKAGGGLRRGARSVDERLRHELTFRREHLNTAVRTIRHVDQRIVRHLDRMHRSAKLRRPLTLDVKSRSSAAAPAVCATAPRGSPPGGHYINRLVAERSPHPLERAPVGGENDDTTIPVAVGDECLVRFRIDEDVSGLMDALRVLVAAADSTATDLQQKLPLVVELEGHIVFEVAQRRRDGRAAADPHAVAIVHRDAMLA